MPTIKYSPELQIRRYQILRHHYRIQLEHVRTYKKEIKSRFFRGVIDSRSWWLYISSLLSLEKTYLSLYLPSTLYKINVCQNEQDKILKYQSLIKHEELKWPLIYRWFMNESLKILNGQSEAVNRRTDNTIAKKRSKRQTMVDRTLFRPLNKPESCIHLCEFNLYKLNTCLFRAQKLVPRRFGLDRFRCIMNMWTVTTTQWCMWRKPVYTENSIHQSLTNLITLNCIEFIVPHSDLTSRP